MVFFFFFVYVFKNEFIHSFKYSFNSIQLSHSFPLVAISGIVAKKFSAVFSCKPCVTNRLPFSRNKGGKWLLQAAVLNHRARGVEAAAASRAAAAANAALAAVFFFALKKEQRTALEAFSGGRDVFTWLSTDFCKSCVHNPTVHWIMRQWHWARLRYCNASDSYRFNCHWKLWMVDAERDGQKVSDQHTSFLFQTFPFQAFFQGLEVNILSGENAAFPIKCDDTFSKWKKAVYDQDSVSLLAFLQSVFSSLSSLFFF